MDRDAKKIQLKPVDDVPVAPSPVIRLESKETLQRGKPVRLDVVMEEPKSGQRLDVPVHEDFEIRTHQPGIDALIEPLATDPDQLEQEWGSDPHRHRNIPWGWFALAGILLAGSTLWSLKQIRDAETIADEIVATTQTVLKTDEETKADEKEKEKAKLSAKLDDEETEDTAEETFPHGIEPVKAETLEIVRDLISLTAPVKGTAKSN